jgi:aspartyl-tRNA(Asn)/glutamyl-tRNA(Gln) amidotransferase subunit C
LVILLIYMAHLTTEDILKLAKLSKLELTNEQVEKFRTEIEEIVGYFDVLQSVDVEGLLPTNQVTGLTNVLRPDEVREYAGQEALLKNLPDREGNQIKVNRMIG